VSPPYAFGGSEHAYVTPRCTHGSRRFVRTPSDWASAESTPHWGWPTEPSLEEIDEGWYESLGDDDVYCVLAESKDEVVGQITYSRPRKRPITATTPRLGTFATSSLPATSGPPGWHCTALL
jgi:hypothetical protein